MVLDDERTVLKIIGILSVTSLVLQLIGFAGNGLEIRERKGTISYEGVWYQTECKDGEGCETLSIGQWYERKGLSLDGLNYSQHIRKGLLLTMALSCCIFCIIFPVIRWRDECSNRQMRLCVIVNSVISGLYWLYEIGLRLRLRQVMVEQHEYIPYFPYSTVSALVGVILILAVGNVCLICECRMIGIEDNRVTEQNNGRYERTELQPITEGATCLPPPAVDGAFSHQESQDVKPSAQDSALPDLSDNVGSGDGRDEELEYLRARLQDVDNQICRKKIETEKKMLRTEIEQKENELKSVDGKVNKPIIRNANLLGYFNIKSTSGQKMLLGLILSVLSTVLQIIAFASNGWKIITQNAQNNVKNVTQSVMHCLLINSMISRKLRLFTATSLGQLCLTIAECCCISCVVLLVVSILRPNIYRRAKIAIMIQAIVSGAVMLSETGMALREFNVEKRIIHYESYFPWSALVGMLGGLSMLVLGFGCFVTEFVRQEKTEGNCLQLRTI